MKTGLVLSVGAGRGAVGAGTLDALNPPQFDYVIGGSVGSLMSAHAAAKDYINLRDAITANHSDVFTYSPFNKDGSMSVRKILYQEFLNRFRKRRKKIGGCNVIDDVGFGSSVALRKYIGEKVSDRLLDQVRDSKTQLIVGVQNLSMPDHPVEYKSLADYSNDDFRDWMWISACAPLVMSLVEKNGHQYCDVGLTESASIKALFDRGCDHVTVIMNQTRKDDVGKSWHANNSFNMGARLAGILYKETQKDEINIGIDAAKDRNRKLTIIWLPKGPDYSTSFYFEKKKLDEWYELGLLSAKDESRYEEYDFTSS